MLCQRLVQRTIQTVDYVGEPFDGTCKGRLRVDAFFWTYRRNNRDRVFNRIEYYNDRRTHQDRIRNSDRIRIWRLKLLHQPHHVVAEIPEHTRRHRRQAIRQRDPAFNDQCAKRRQWWFGTRAELIRVISRGTIDFGFAFHRAPDQVRLESDDRIAPANRSAFDQLEQKAHCLAAAELQKGGDRGFQVGHQGGPHHLRFVAPIAFGKGGFRRLDLHGSKLLLGAAAGRLVQGGRVNIYAEIVLQPPNEFVDDIVDVGILQRVVDRLALRR